MNKNKLKIIVTISLFGILAILSIQLHWLNQAFDYEQTKFDQKVHVALLEVVKNLYGKEDVELPMSNPVQKISKDYYVVDINQDFEVELLDFFLKREFQLYGINTDFLYAIYDCENDKMLYGNTIEYETESSEAKEYFPKFDNLVYYFSIRFPSKTSFLFSSMKLWILFSVLLFGILTSSVYFIFLTIQQKKYSDLQRDFINNMTHEFKTPLTSILIASDYIYQKSEKTDTSKFKTYGRLISEQAQKLNKHVERILELAKSESGKLELEKSDTSLIEITKKVQSEFLLNETNLNLTFEHQKLEKANVILDRNHFHNILFNLIDNAIKYSDDDPKIQITLSKEESFYKLSVRDEGKGISEQAIKKIYTKFYRVNQGDSAYQNGFGLGLFYTKGICDLHGFGISCESKLGIGTTMSITLPIH